MTLPGQGTLPDATGADVCGHLKERGNHQPRGLGLLQEPGVLLGLSEVDPDGNDGGQQQDTGDEASADTEFR